MAHDKLDKNAELMLAGYLDMLVKSPPNGRLVHARKNAEQGIRLCLQMGMPMSEEQVKKVKKLIHELYDK